MAYNNAGNQAPPCDAADGPVDTFDRVNGIKPARRLGLHEARPAVHAEPEQRCDRELFLAWR